MKPVSFAANVNQHPKRNRLSWGVVELQVTNLDRAIEFWTSALGLIERETSGPGVALGTQETSLFILHPGAEIPVSAPYTGMYHVALGVRSQAVFSQMMARLIHQNIPFAPTDHLMAKSIYLKDPDGLEVEITYETPERFAHFGDMSKGLALYDTNGEVHSGRGPLDITAELAHVAGADPMVALANDSYIAHLHFKVAQLEPAIEWFETLGFERHLTLNHWGFADMGAGVPNTHRLAMNVWSGTDNPPAPSTMARLVHYELISHDKALPLSPHLRQTEDVMTGIDPAGVHLTLRTRT